MLNTLPSALSVGVAKISVEFWTNPLNLRIFIWLERYERVLIVESNWEKSVLYIAKNMSGFDNFFYLTCHELIRHKSHQEIRSNILFAIFLFNTVVFIPVISPKHTTFLSQFLAIKIFSVCIYFIYLLLNKRFLTFKIDDSLYNITLRNIFLNIYHLFYCPSL